MCACVRACVRLLDVENNLVHNRNVPDIRAAQSEDSCSLNTITSPRKRKITVLISIVVTRVYQSAPANHHDYKERVTISGLSRYVRLSVSD